MCADEATPLSRRRNGFDKLARPYRWLEYLSFGPLLWRSRVLWLEHMLYAREALVLGDGDGRFTAALLRANRDVRVHAVDASAAMLRQVTRRAIAQGDGERVTPVCADATAWLPSAAFDLVCSHFFLDCLDDAQCVALARQVADRMPAGSVWVVTDFAIPPGALRWPAWLLVRLLYAAFGVLTGLRVRRLPEYAMALGAAGLRSVAVRQLLCGVLRSELWQRDG